MLFDTLFVLEQVFEFVFRLQVLALLPFVQWLQSLHLLHGLLLLLPEVSEVIHELPLQLGFFLLADAVFVTVELVLAILIVHV